MQKTICLLPGDGIGPEIVAEAVKVLRAVEKKFGHSFTMTEALLGGAAIDAVGVPLPDATVEACKAADAVFLGAVGGPKWDTIDPAIRPERGLLGIRKALGLFANRATKILLYIIQNADSSNIVHCTYKDIMRDCEIKDKRIVTKTLKEMQEAEIIVKISQSRYMLNPAVMVQGKDQKLGMLAETFRDFLREKKRSVKAKAEAKEKEKKDDVL